MKIFNRSSSFKKSAFQIIQELKIKSGNLELIADKLRKRDEALFEMCTRAIEKEERQRAKIYASELAEVRTLLNTITHSELAIEWIMIRLENFLDFTNLVADLKPTISVIQNLARHVTQVMPSMASLIDRLSNLVNDTLVETKLDLTQLPSTINVKNVESEDILNEVTIHLEQKLKTALPEPPTQTTTYEKNTKSKEKDREAVPIPVG